MGQSAQPLNKDNWKPNKHIAKIYDLLHNGDVKQVREREREREENS